jgi:alpha-amylase/alpha-mannosidase (GH57 family)
MKRSYIMLLWHMHQPFYKDLAEGTYMMPWVRLHALKDYFGMVAILREFPAVHMTFNLVPSLVAQLDEYARDEAREPAYDLAFKPAAELSRADRENLLQQAFQLNHENLMSRYPRLRELYERRESAGIQAAARLLSDQDFIDLQVLSQVAWFDEIYLAQDPVVHRLVARGRAFAEEDKVQLRKKEVELLNVILEEYRSGIQRGQIEVSTSPYYHPILPLLCDSHAAVESHPGINLPRQPFVHPEDARAQIQEAVALHERFFGSRPKGLWPSEGSVSDCVLTVAAEEGFQWLATDEGVLGRSLQVNFQRDGSGNLPNGHELYRPYRFQSDGHAISIFFRDHQLSDLIGFVYSHMDAGDAAHDLHSRIRRAAENTGGQSPVIPIILDGENAWEYYPGNGRAFLKNFYGLLADDPDLRSVTASEALQVAEQGTLTHVVPGSWINANFDVWIGAEEDNRAWDLLHDARVYFDRHSRNPGLDPAHRSLAQHELWVAEGSDWCWWYGPEHSSAHDEEFDLLYRKHLSNIYRMLGGSPPDELAIPIKRPKAAAVSPPPTGSITPRIDGVVTNYFEWLGAGLCLSDDRSGSMHGGREYLESLYYGYDGQALFLRLDFRPGFAEDHSVFEIRANFDSQIRARLHARVREGRLVQTQFWLRDNELLVPLGTGSKMEAAFLKIFELKLNYDLLEIQPGTKVRLQVALWANDLPLQVFPKEGWLSLELTSEMVSW